MMQVQVHAWWTWLAAGRRDDLLELDIRRRVWDYLVRYPGVHLSGIADALDLETNHAKYHLQYMEKHGLVSGRREDGYWRFWPSEDRQPGSRGKAEADVDTDNADATATAMGRDDKKRLAALRKPVPLHATLVLLDQGELPLSDLADELDVAVSTAHYHVKRLEAAGIVESRREGRERRVAVIDGAGVRALLVKHKPPPNLVSGFLDVWESMDL